MAATMVPGALHRWQRTPLLKKYDVSTVLSFAYHRRFKYLLPSTGRLVLAASSSSSPPSSSKSATAESCVNLGLSLFSKGRVKDALEQFETALLLDPNPVEKQAALYNKACCHAYRGEGNKAADSLRIALRDYKLKFSVILNDPDLASFRSQPEFKELQEEARQGGEDIGYGFRRDLKLISEVQAPFRGVRKFFYIAFVAAAGISTFFTIPRLIRAINGGEGAPGISDTLLNGAINIGVYRYHCFCCIIYMGE